jgi:hypothetical protein
VPFTMGRSPGKHGFRASNMSATRPTDRLPPCATAPSLQEDALARASAVQSGASAGDSEAEELAPRKRLPPLLLKLAEVQPERLDYLGVSFGATPPLYKFWKKCGFAPVYLRQTKVPRSPCRTGCAEVQAPHASASRGPDVPLTPNLERAHGRAHLHHVEPLGHSPGLAGMATWVLA